MATKKNTSKCTLIPGPDFDAGSKVVINTMVKGAGPSLVDGTMNSTGNAVMITLKLFVGSEIEKNDRDYKYSDSGSLTLPDIVEIDGIEYWLNVRSAWQKTKDGRSFKAGRNKISLSVKGVKAEKSAVTQDIPF